MRQLTGLAVLLGLAAACDPARDCVAGSTRACTCDGGARNGLATCEPVGGGYLACDCTETACAPKATQTCLGDELFDVDACGNRAALASVLCACPCIEGSSTCAPWDEPVAMTPPASCTLATACLDLEHLHCEPVEGQWVHGWRWTNVCDHAIRCYTYEYTSRFFMIGDRRIGSEERGYLGPPSWPQLTSGQSTWGGSIFTTEAVCRSEWDVPSVVEFSYAVCVLADDPPATCLPDLADPLATLAPVCHTG